MTIDMTVQYLNFIQCTRKPQISRSKTYQCNFQRRLYGSKVRSSGTATKSANVPHSLSWSRHQINKCTTVNIYGHGTNQHLSHGTKITDVVPRCSLIKFYPGHADQNNNVIQQSLIQFYPESGNQINKCTTVNIYGHGTNQQV